jgi:hypothetical protein
MPYAKVYSIRALKSAEPFVAETFSVPYKRAIH